MLIKKLKRSKGFTLIELMIVIAIIMILMSIAIPQFINYKNMGDNTQTIEVIDQDEEMSLQKESPDDKGENKQL